MVKINKAKKPVVFFDFDNTITLGDVLDDIIERYSINFKWQELEKMWRAGKIGSRQCLEGQMEGIRITKADLDRYLACVRIDPYFKILLKYLRSRNIKTFILSDNFDYILTRILKNHNITDQAVYANSIRFDNNRLKTAFPYSNKKCGDCGHCKQTTLLSKMDKDSFSIYIGDGQSDICGSEQADVVFAKDSLKKYFRRERKAFVPFKTLKDVYNYLKDIEISEAGSRERNAGFSIREVNNERKTEDVVA